jgi:hypothetical protein
MDVDEVVIARPTIGVSPYERLIAPSNSNAKMRISLLQDPHFIQAAKLDHSLSQGPIEVRCSFF